MQSNQDDALRLLLERLNTSFNVLAQNQLQATRDLQAGVTATMEAVLINQKQLEVMISQLMGMAVETQEELQKLRAELQTTREQVGKVSRGLRRQMYE